MPNIFYRRQFLNIEEYGGSAMVEATVGEVSDGGNFDATFKVGDCTRLVDLDFSAYSDETAENVVIKLVRFRKAVLAFEAAVLVALKERKS